jgi:hypothetical protein
LYPTKYPEETVILSVSEETVILSVSIGIFQLTPVMFVDRQSFFILGTMEVFSDV